MYPLAHLRIVKNCIVGCPVCIIGWSVRRLIDVRRLPHAEHALRTVADHDVAKQHGVVSRADVVVGYGGCGALGDCTAIIGRVST